jgi:putative salt-induced outer membrane protein YdiY
MKTAILCIPLLALASGAYAGETKPWKDSAELSYVQTSGNSKVSTLSGKNLFNYDWQKSALELVAGGLGTESRNVVTAEQYNASEKVSFKFTGKNYAFQKNSWDKNRFANIKDRWDLSLGVGRHILDTAVNNLFAEAGGGYVFEDRLSGTDNQSFGSYRAYAKYIRTLSPTANVSQDMEYLGNLKDSGNYRMNAETALVTTINSHFSLKASHSWKFANSPGAGFKKTDTMNAMALIVNY